MFFIDLNNIGQRRETLLDRTLLAVGIQLQFIDRRPPQSLFEGLLVGVHAVTGLRRVPKVRLENPRCADRQEVFVHQRFNPQATAAEQVFQGGVCQVARRQAFFRHEVAEVSQALLAHAFPGVREFAEVLRHERVVTRGVGFVGKVLEFVPRGIEQAVVQGAAFGREGGSALFDLAEAGTVAAASFVLIGEGNRLVEGLETGLAQQDRALTCLLYTSPSPRDGLLSRMPSSA